MSNISVTITADVADLVAKRAVLSAELRTATSDLNAFAKTAATSGMTSELRASMLASAQAVSTLKAQIVSVTAEIKGMGASAPSAFAQIRAGAMEASEAMGAFRGLIAGIGQAFIAAFAVKEIEDFASGMAEVALSAEHTALTFGLSTAQVQRMKAEAVGLGIPFEAFTTAMQRVDRALTSAREGSKTAGTAFRTLGIDIHEPIGQTQLLQEAIAGLAGVEDIPTRIGLAMQLFGRNIQNIAPLIGVTKEQLAELNTTIDASGAVDDKAEQSGLALSDAINKQKIAMMGLQNALTTALAPALTIIATEFTKLVLEFVDSYNKGGLAKTILDGLAVSAKALVAAIDVLVRSVIFLIDVYNSLVDAGTAVVQVFNRNLPAAAAASKKSLDDLNAAGQQVVQTMRDLANLFGPGGALPALPQGSTGGAPPGGLGHGGGHHGQDKAYEAKIAKDELMLASDREFHDKELADFDKYLADVAAKYGTDSKEYYDALKRKVEYEQTYAKEQARIATEAAKKALEEQIKTVNEQTQIALKGAAAQLEAQKAGIAAQIANVQFLAEQGQISQAQAYAEIEALHAQETADEEQAAQRKYQIESDGLARRMTLEKADTDAWKRDLDTRLGLWSDFQDKLVTIQQQGLAWLDGDWKAELSKIRSEWTSAISPIVSSFTSGLEQMAEGTKSFAQFMADIGRTILTDMLRIIDKMVTNWLVGEITKRAASVTTASVQVAATSAGATQVMAIQGVMSLKEIMNSAATAAAAAYKALAGIPIIGPELGAAAAAVTFAAVAAFRGFIASAAGGYDIPSGINPLVQAHGGEMILPSPLANSVRQMAANQNHANSNEGGGSGGNHYHNWEISGAIDGVSLQRVLENNPDALAGAMESIVRRRNGRGFGE